MEVPSTLHKQKITILSRLIKESSLTLEEALLLLEEEQPDKIPMSTPGTTTQWIQPYSFGTYTNTSSSFAGQVLEQLIKESKDATI